MRSNRFLSSLSRVVVAALALSVLAPVAAQAEKVKTKTALTSTGVVPGAGGVARLIVRTSTRGGFGVQASSLAPSSSYDVLVGGIKVATLPSDDTGYGRVRFSTGKVGENLVLGFDPRGEAIEIRGATGDDVLVGHVAAPAGSETDKACCIPGGEHTECEDRTPADCTALGGTSSAAGSCFPDPCGSARPPAASVVCCVPDNSGPLCEDRSQADCLTAGGSVVQADSCASDPCNAAPPSPDDHVQCCVAAYYVWACEDHTVAECEQLGGLDKGPGSCSPNPCGDVPPSIAHGICCLPSPAGDEVECEDFNATDCTAAGGVAKGTGGACDATTCADVPPPNPDVMCCVQPPLSGEVECESQTVSDCAAAGGFNKGAGVCAIDTCADVVPVETGVMCCEPNGGNNEIRCENHTLARCLADGGTSLGDGSCPAVDPCLQPSGSNSGAN
jgi:hypothetical protein